MDVHLLDTNAVADFYSGKSGHLAVARIWEADELLFVTNLTVLELYSVFAKWAREDPSRFGVDGFRQAAKRLQYDVSSLGRLRVRAIRRSFDGLPRRLIERYAAEQGRSLRTLDALHLAAAIDLNAEHDDFVFVTSDRNLLGVAELEGLQVINPRLAERS